MSEATIIMKSDGDTEELFKSVFICRVVRGGPTFFNRAL